MTFQEPIIQDDHLIAFVITSGLMFSFCIPKPWRRDQAFGMRFHTEIEILCDRSLYSDEQTSNTRAKNDSSAYLITQQTPKKSKYRKKSINKPKHRKKIFK